MRKYSVFIIFAFLFIIVPIHVQADECDYTTIAKLKRLASNINTSYVPVETDDSVTFNITISNIYQTLRVKDLETGNEYRYDVSRTIPHEITLTGLEPGRTYRYEVYSDNCTGTLLNSYYVILPGYNPYYNDPLCIDLPNYQLCSKWSSLDMTYEEFTKKITKYREELNQTEEKENKTKEMNVILEFIIEYWYVFVGLAILGTGYVIYVRRKRDSFGF